MYEYIHSDDIDYMFNVFTLKEIHEKLYSKTEYPEFGGNFRRSDAYIKDFPSDLVSYPFIFRELDKLDAKGYDLDVEIEEKRKTRDGLVKNTRKALEYFNTTIEEEEK